MLRLLLILMVFLVDTMTQAQSFAERTARTPIVEQKLDTIEYSWNYTFASKDSLTASMPPQTSSRFLTTASYYQNRGRVEYVWMRTCPGVVDGDTILGHSGTPGCWMKAKGALVGDGTYIIRDGDTVFFNQAAADARYAKVTDLDNKQNTLGFTPYNATNPAGYITISALTWAAIGGKPAFATVATSGLYTDLFGRPTIPTTTSQLTNNSGFITSAPATNLGSSVLGNNVTITSSTGSSTTFTAPVATSLPYGSITGTPTIPTNTNQLTNGAGFITSAPATNLTNSVNGTTGATTINSSTGTSTIFTPTPYTAGTGINVAGLLITNTAPNQNDAPLWSKTALISGTPRIVVDTFSIASATPTITLPLPSGTTVARVMAATGYRVSATANNSPQVSISGMTATTVSLVLTQSNSTAVSLLGINVLGLQAVPDPANVKVLISYVAY